jgi:hypothetical protein
LTSATLPGGDDLVRLVERQSHDGGGQESDDATPG